MSNPLNAFLLMRKDIIAHSRIMAVWGAALHIPPSLGALFYITTLDGLSVAIGVILSLVIAAQVHRRKPMSRLIGISHVFYIPPVLILGQTLLEGTGSLLFKTWAVYSFAIMGIGVILDVGNVALYYFSSNKSLIKENN